MNNCAKRKKIFWGCFGYFFKEKIKKIKSVVTKKSWQKPWAARTTSLLRHQHRPEALRGLVNLHRIQIEERCHHQGRFHDEAQCVLLLE